MSKIDIYKKFDKLSNESKRDVMFTALDIMQQYNGRSKMFCFYSAMGYKCVEQEDGTYKYLKEKG